MVLILSMRWEHQRLSMQKEDLEEKWREIQQTKLSKENQRALGESSQVMVVEAKVFVAKQSQRRQAVVRSSLPWTGQTSRGRCSMPRRWRSWAASWPALRR